MSLLAPAFSVVIDRFDALPSGGHEPMSVRIIRRLNSEDGAEYWLGELPSKIAYEKAGRTISVKYAVVAPGWQGMSFVDAFEDGRVNLAYVTDETLLQDTSMDFAKADYVAFGSGRVTPMIVGSDRGTALLDLVDSASFRPFERLWRWFLR